MTKPHPWFRFYSEAVRDRKLEAACRLTQHPRVMVIGAWATLLALANDSPTRGILLLTEEMPLTDEDIAREFGLDLPTTQSLLVAFVKLTLLWEEGEAYGITAWCKRQSIA